MKRFKVGKSHYNIFAADPGKLIPVSCYEGLPGETIQQSSQVLIRVLPQNTPVMHPVTVRVHTWQIPLRIIWPEFEQFITGGPDGNDVTIPPRIQGTVEKNSPADFLGIKPGVRDISELPLRAVNKTFNEKYRDQDLVGELPESGTIGITADDLPNIAWEKTRETSARPWPQKGPDVTIPLGETAPVIPAGDSIPRFSVDGNTTSLQSAVGNNAQFGSSATGVVNAIWDEPNLATDLSQAVSPNINDWRTAFAVQRWQEARAQYGSRFTEYLRYCGVISSDQRLQLPEYLGGGKQIISFSEILSTNELSEAVDSQKAGALRGHGIAALRTRPFRRFIEEHSYILTFLSIRPKLMWMAGQHRMWDRVDKMDWFQKELQYIGQEEIYNREISVDHSIPGGVFGFNNRYGSFVKIPSRVSGEMRESLNTWHMARDIVGDFALNEDFVNCNPTDRVYQQSVTPNYVVMFNNQVRARTPVDPRPYNRIV